MKIKVEITVDPASLRRLAEDLSLYRHAPYGNEDCGDEGDDDYRHHIDDLRDLAYDVLECWRRQARP